MANVENNPIIRQGFPPVETISHDKAAFGLIMIVLSIFVAMLGIMFIQPALDNLFLKKIGIVCLVGSVISGVVGSYFYLDDSRKKKHEEKNV